MKKYGITKQRSDIESTTRDKNRMSLSRRFLTLVIMASGCSSSARFAHISSIVQEFIEDNENEPTRRKTKHDVALFHEFLSAKEESRLVEEIPAETLDDSLSEFIITVRKNDNDGQL